MSGIKSIIDLINKKTQERIETILKRAEEYKASKLNAAMEESKQVQADIIAETKRETDTIIKRYEASALLKAKQDILKVKNDLIVKVLEDALKQATDKTKQKDFESTLSRYIVDAGIALKDPDLEILVPEGYTLTVDLKAIAKEIEKETGVKTKLSVADEKVDASAGVIVRAKDGTKWIDNTLEARYSRLEASLRDMIASVLFSEENE